MKGSTVDWHPGFESVGDCLLRSVQFSRPTRDAKRDAVVRDATGARRVLALFLHRGPTAIDRFVVAIVVDALNRVLQRRARTHVGKEARERLAPRCADFDSAASVTVVVGTRGVLASHDHVLPDTILGRLAHAVRARSRSARVVIEATATRCMAASKATGRYLIRPAAVASAAPVRLVVSILRSRNNYEPPEPLPDQIVTFHQEKNTTMGICSNV